MQSNNERQHGMSEPPTRNVGRPKLPADRKRDAYVKLRLSRREIESVYEEAIASRKPLARFAREALIEAVAARNRARHA